MIGVASVARPGDDIYIGLAIYDASVVSEISRIPGATPEGKRWRIPASQGQAAARLADVYSLRRIGHVPELSIGNDDAIEIPRGELMPHQESGVRIIKGFGGRAILGDGMGVGKTLTSLALGWHEQAWPMVVVCPEMLRTNWANESSRFLRIAPRVLKGSPKPSVLTPPWKIYIIGYSILGRWAEQLAALKPGLVVFDESHYIKNPTSQRSRAAAKLSASAGMVVAATGTLIINRPDELIHQLKTIGAIDLVGGEKLVRERYCGSREAVRVGSDGRARKTWINGASDPAMLEELHRRLKATCYVRRELREVIHDLPSMSSMHQALEVEDLSAYRQAEERLEQAGRGDWSDHHVRAEANASISTMKKELGIQKIAPGVEWVKNLSDQTDEKILVFFYHRAVGEALQEQLGCPMVYGGLSPKRKDEIVAEFQAGNSKILALSLSVGNVGLNLTAASQVVFLEFDWTPSSMEQAAARAMRKGQERDVSVWWLAAASTVEELLIAKLVDKVEITSVINSGRYSPGVVSALIKEGVLS